MTGHGGRCGLGHEIGPATFRVVMAAPESPRKVSDNSRTVNVEFIPRTRRLGQLSHDEDVTFRAICKLSFGLVDDRFGSRLCKLADSMQEY